MSNPISIMWFRQDLRISDNPALLEASRLGTILPIYILDDLGPIEGKMGDMTKVYLDHALQCLNQTLEGNLNVYKGEPASIISNLIKSFNIKHIYWNRCYEPWFIVHDEIIKDKLRVLNVHYTIFEGSYLWDPEKIIKDDGSYYKVFGAYKRKALLSEPRKPWAAPKNLIFITDKKNKTKLGNLQLVPNHPWHKKIMRHWPVGEQAAKKKLKSFVKDNLLHYKMGRDYPGLDHTSKLSPHLHFGEISPNQIWRAVNTKVLDTHREDTQHFISEIIWREFSCYLLYHFKGLYKDNVQKKFDKFSWKNAASLLKAWQKGNTGYPLVDAGMRELWQTGYMHNRIRMVVASFLVKNLMIHWHFGRDWFSNCLVDADLANNCMNWQWVAGCGVDSAPYFRIFNPITQGEKFDAAGHYTKKYVPELKNLPNKYLFKPWLAPETILSAAGVILGQTYPQPIVDIKASREAALMSYRLLK